jgi:hypothetical protein
MKKFILKIFNYFKKPDSIKLEFIKTEYSDLLMVKSEYGQCKLYLFSKEEVDKLNKIAGELYERNRIS